MSNVNLFKIERFAWIKLGEKVSHDNCENYFRLKNVLMSEGKAKGWKWEEKRRELFSHEKSAFVFSV